MKAINSILSLFLLLQFASTANANEMPRERLYMQTDKDLYLAGELIRIKLISTDTEGKVFDLSKVGYIELTGEAESPIQTKVELDRGVGEGWIALPTHLTSGNYRLVAYTRYMRNEGEKVFFEKSISVINAFLPDMTQSLVIDTLLTTEDIHTRDNTVTLKTNRAFYTRRDMGQVQIEGLPENVRTLSVTISGKSFHMGHPAKDIRRFYPVHNNNATAFTLDYLPEYEGPIITGQMIDVNSGEPRTAINTVPLLSFVGDKIRLFSGNVDDKARVTYYTKGVSGTEEMVTKVLSPVDEQFRVDIQSAFAELTPKAPTPLQWNPAWNEQVLHRSIGLQVQHHFLPDSLSKTETSDPIFSWKPYRVYPLDEYTRFTTMEEVVVEILAAIRFRRINNKRIMSVFMEEGSAYAVGNSLVLLDGIPITDHEIIFRYDPLKIKTVEVYMGNYLFGGQMFAGIISMQTYNNDYPGLTLHNSTQFFDHPGPAGHRHFYSPVYDSQEERNNRLPDYRHTLLWIPEIPIENSTSIVIPFSTSDLPGEYVVTVEGLTTDGLPIYARSPIKVE